MQATLPMRSSNTTTTGLAALLLATMIVFGSALAFGAARTPTTTGQPAAQTIEQSVVNHAIDERAQPGALQAPALVDPRTDDKVGSRNQADARLFVAPDDAPSVRNRIVNVPQ